MTLEQTLKTLKAAFSSKSAEAEAFASQLSEMKAKNDTLAAEYATVAEQLIAANAAVAPSPQAVTTCRSSLWVQSPQAKIPGADVRMS